MTEIEGLIRVALAVVFGAVIGFDREAHSLSAGLRTHILVTLDADAFTVLGIQSVESPMFQSDNVTLDPSRIIQAAITGIGFLGGAIIFRDDDRARNVTTAAGIWAVTAVSIVVGLGYYVLATGVTGLPLFVLYLLKLLKRQVRA